jgi:hypothetical protein
MFDIKYKELFHDLQETLSAYLLTIKKIIENSIKTNIQRPKAKT